MMGKAGTEPDTTKPSDYAQGYCDGMYDRASSIPKTLEWRRGWRNGRADGEPGWDTPRDSAKIERA
jgi:hypothetical protein